MLKNKMILAVIAVIIALGLAGCRAEKDNVSSVAVNAESSITETVSDISETPADASSNKTAEITEKPESSARRFTTVIRIAAASAVRTKTRTGISGDFFQRGKIRT